MINNDDLIGQNVLKIVNETSKGNESEDFYKASFTQNNEESER